ncbi:unnamed protein product [Adineta steineri]|uniref:Uncharacterized protein n=1 Tax=Adineta steineri TaxID=433720 RepID=A0A819SIY5_9BILA|nr:unnamed protein product [Adineta steineri]
MLTITQLSLVILCLYASFCVIHGASVYQMNEEIRQGRAPKTIKRIDAANPDLFDRFIHAHFSGDENLALYINGEWKHGSKTLTNAEKTWLKNNGWKNIG